MRPRSFNRCAIPRIHCVVVEVSADNAGHERTSQPDILLAKVDLLKKVDPFVLQVIDQLSRRGPAAEAPTPIEYESPDWEPASDEDYERRPADDEPWDLP
jgi:hypothetical protein